MAVKKPIKSTITGPAQTIEEKAALFLYLAQDSLRKDPGYSSKMITYIKEIYSTKGKPLPENLALQINKLENMLKG